MEKEVLSLPIVIIARIEIYHLSRACWELYFMPECSTCLLGLCIISSFGGPGFKIQN